MTEQEKQLLLQDLSGRFPYGVKVDYPLWHNSDPEEVVHNIDGSINKVKDFLTIRADVLDWKELPKPYLRLMSSMTEEEKSDFHNFKYWILQGDVEHCTINMMDWLNAHHFDYRGLIEKELALEAQEGMY